MNDAAHEQFLLDRCGSLGASEVPDILRKGKDGGPSASRKNMLAKKVLERLTGKPVKGYTSRAMQDGLDRQEQAKSEFSFVTDLEVIPVPAPGIIAHPTIIGAHASPDGLIGEDAIYEGKAPESAQHFEMLETKKIATDYLTQIQWQLCCSRRAEAWFCSWGGPEFPMAMQLFIKRVPRDPVRIVAIEHEVMRFLAELDETVERLRRAYL